MLDTIVTAHAHVCVSTRTAGKLLYEAGRVSEALECLHVAAEKDESDLTLVNLGRGEDLFHPLCLVGEWTLCRLRLCFSCSLRSDGCGRLRILSEDHCSSKEEQSITTD